MAIIRRFPVLEDVLETADISKHTVGEALRAWIEYMNTRGGDEKRIGVRDIADAAGLPSSRVSDVLTGRRVPRRDELDMICLALGMGKDSRVKLQGLRLHEASQRSRSSLSEEAYTVVRTRNGDTVVPSPRLLTASEVRQRSVQPVPAFGQPDPIRVSSVQELVLALKAVHVWAGAPSLRELERRSRTVLRRSTISDMLRGESLPDYERYVAFLRACGVDGPSLDTWVFVWRRLSALENPEVAPWLPGATAS
ncbi:helix-turn-helix transcriptional regulator [Streptomyces sp. NPDC048389]|uniref:helix-turn-helix domain-containing protein n=1 Tax=Streptomyces sp. NPDC048389 TaxID=3154622 RepID=UPI00345282C9